MLWLGLNQVLSLLQSLTFTANDNVVPFLVKVAQHDSESIVRKSAAYAIAQTLGNEAPQSVQEMAISELCVGG